MLSGSDPGLSVLAAGVAGVLLVASATGAVLHLTVRSEKGRKTVANLNARTRAWWVMAGVFGVALAAGRGAVCVLFGFMSFTALRELLTLAPTRRGDHHTLFWAMFVVVPLQYYMIYIGWYGMFSIFIPVYCLLFFALRSTLSGDASRYLERVAKIQWSVMVGVYFLSHAAALLTFESTRFKHDGGKLLVFLVVVAQMSDVLQYVWGKVVGRRKIAPHLSPNKTWEGFVGGVLSATALGTALWWMTPFLPLQALYLSLTIALMGFFGGIVMSAVKRDAGVKDYGHLIEGHGGIMDRVDSLTFAAPVFFHAVRYWFV